MPPSHHAWRREAFQQRCRVAHFFSTVTMFGTAFDVTLEDLRIEALHPADTETERLVRNGDWLATRH